MVNLIAYGMLALTLVVAGVTDLTSGRIYNRLTYPATLIGLAYWLIAGLGGYQVGIGHALLGLAAALVPFIIVMQLGGIGGGDMKLMAAVGALSASWRVVLATSFYALILAALAAIIVMIRQGLVKQTFARIMGIALSLPSKTPANHRQPTATSSQSTEQPAHHAQDDCSANADSSTPTSVSTSPSPRIAFGTAAALGGLLAGAEYLLGLHTPWAWLGP